MSKELKKYAKVVYWSNEDKCYVGICPGLFVGGCHGDDQKSVFDQLCVIVEEIRIDQRSWSGFARANRWR